MSLVQSRLVVVRIDVAHTADEANVYRPLGPWRKVRERRVGTKRRPGGGVARQQASECRGADTPDTPVEKLPSIQSAQVVHIS